MWGTRVAKRVWRTPPPLSAKARAMGVDNLLPFLAKHAAVAITRIGKDVAALSGSRVAVDVPIQMYRAVYVKGSEQADVVNEWFLQFHRRLVRERITPVYVFDGARVEAKSMEIAKRAEAMTSARQRATMARARFNTLQTAAFDMDRQLGRAYSTSAGTLFSMQETSDAELVAAMFGDTKGSATDVKGSATDAVADAVADMQSTADGSLRLLSPFEKLVQASDDLRKAEARLIKPQAHHYLAVRAYLEGLGARCVVAPTEAEKECAKLCASGEVDIAITDDSDALPFGATRVCFQYGRHDAYIVELDKVLAALGLSLDAFRHFCVMCGCDFVERIPFVGPVKAFPLIKEHGSIEAVLAQREAVRDPRFTEGVITERLHRAEDDVCIFETQVAELQDMLTELGSAAPMALAAQVGKVSSQLEMARKSAHEERKQLHGLQDFKRRYTTALDIFRLPDIVPTTAV